MDEFFNILNDIRSGALPVNELPGFIMWGMGRMGWFWFVVVVVLLIRQQAYQVPGASIRSSLKVRCARRVWQ